jgi:uncharacterized protein
MATLSPAPHFPRPALIDAYGDGGFRFAGLSHRGSLLCLPSGIWAWPPVAPAEIDEAALRRVFAEATAIEFFLLGVGKDLWLLPEALRQQFKEHRIGVEVMTTGAAVRTYNILRGEDRRAGAGLVAVK